MGSKRPFVDVYRAVRKFQDDQKEHASISDSLKELKTNQAKRARPTFGERLSRWAKRFRWQDGSYFKMLGAASRSEGGSSGYVATASAMNDIYEIM